MTASSARVPGSALSDEPIGEHSPEARPAVYMVLGIVGAARAVKPGEQRLNLRWMEVRARFVDREVAAHRGQILQGTSEGLVASFGRAIDAVRCAVELQRDIPAANQAAPEQPPIEIRIGINTGNGQIARDAAPHDSKDVANALLERAAPGGIVISGPVLEQIGGADDIETEALGVVDLKKSPRQVHAYRVAYRQIGATPPAKLRNAPLRHISVGVLPFKSGTADKRDEYFTEGIAEDIVSALGGVTDLVVVSRNTGPYQGEAIDARAIGRRLGVRYLVGGTATRGDDRLKLDVDLTDAETGGTLWHHDFDVPLSKIFDLQDDIALRIARFLVPTLGDAELRRSMGKRPENLDAYDLVLQAMYRMYRLDREGFAAARTLLSRAIALDPDYATAYALLAEWHMLNIGQGYAEDENAAMADLVRLANSAIERHKSDPLALALLGHCKAWLFREFDEALDLFEQAFAASPNSASAWGWSSPTCSYLGDGESAVVHAEYALRLSPLGPHAYFFRSALGLAHYTNGDYDEAARWGRRAMAANPLYASNLRFLAASLAARGRLQDARSVGRALLALRPDFSVKRFISRPSYKDLQRTLAMGEHLRLAGLPD